MTKQTKKRDGRWQSGNQRYGKGDGAALKKVREADGWKNGARVVRR